MKEKKNKNKNKNKNVGKSATEQKKLKQDTSKHTNVTNKKREEEKTSAVTSNEMINLIKIVLIVIAVFLIFYGITTLVTENKEISETGETTIQYDEILLGTLFEQPNTEYYVLVTKEDDVYASTYLSLVSMYSSEKEAIRFYTANLDNGFNKLYEAEESNTKTNDLQELKFKVSTLLKIKDKKIVAVYEGKDTIIEHLNSLLK